MHLSVATKLGLVSVYRCGEGGEVGLCVEEEERVGAKRQRNKVNLSNVFRFRSPLSLPLIPTSLTWINNDVLVSHQQDGSMKFWEPLKQTSAVDLFYKTNSNSISPPVSPAVAVRSSSPAHSYKKSSRANVIGR